MPVLRIVLTAAAAIAAGPSVPASDDADPVRPAADVITAVVAEPTAGPKTAAARTTRAFVGMSVELRVAAAPGEASVTPLEPSPPTRCRPTAPVTLDDLPVARDPFLAATTRRHAGDSPDLPLRLIPVETATPESEGLIVDLAPSEPEEPVETGAAPAEPQRLPEAEPEESLAEVIPGPARPPRRLPTGAVPMPLDGPRQRVGPQPPAADGNDVREEDESDASVAEADPAERSPGEPDATEERPTPEAVAAAEPTAEPADPESSEDASDDTPPAAVAEAEPAAPRTSDGYLVPDGDPVAVAVADAIDVTSRRVLTTDEHTPWQIAHGLLALREGYRIRTDGEVVNALGWIATNPVHDGTRWFARTRYGARPQPFTVPYAFEGHPNQFLAFMTMADLPDDYAVVIDGRKVPFEYFVKNAQATLNDREETSWTLWMLANRLDTDARWFASDRSVWDFPRLLRKEMSQPVTKKACGGNHGLFALATARNARVRSGKPFRGVWRQTHQFVAQHMALAKRLQNPDGSLSSNYYKGRETTDDPSKRVSTSGHTLEFLVCAATKAQLSEEWLRNAARSVASDLVTYQSEPLEVGGMYHALHALVIYRERTFAKPTETPGGRTLELADRPGDSAVR